MNVAEYQIALTVRRRIPLDVEPPADAVQTLDDGTPLVTLEAMDEATLAAVVERFTRVIGEREDDEHNHIADRLYLAGQMIARDTPDVIVEISHVVNLTPPTRITP